MKDLSLLVAGCYQLPHTHSYCGHGTGREYLSTDGFHQLCCQATTVLMGCSSGRLTGGGACEPGGVAFNYLMAKL